MDTEIKCPRCGHVLTKTELLVMGMETTYGLDGWVDLDCPACDEPFQAKECVVRTWEIRIHE